MCLGAINIKESYVLCILYISEYGNMHAECLSHHVGYGVRLTIVSLAADAVVVV